MTTKFIQPVSMRVTEEQYLRDLREPLLAMGYEESLITSFTHTPILVNNYGGRNGILSNTCEEAVIIENRHFIPDYNPEYFLAVAAMTSEKFGIVGEWWRSIGELTSYPIGNRLFTKGKLYKGIKNLRDYITFVSDIGQEQRVGVYNLQYFTKATLQDLIAYFETDSAVKNNTAMEAKKPKIDDVLACISEFNKNAERFLDAKREAVANLRESAVALTEICKEELDKKVVVFFNKPYLIRDKEHVFIRVGAYVHFLCTDVNVHEEVRGRSLKFNPMHKEGLTEAELLKYFRLELREITDASDI